MPDILSSDELSDLLAAVDDSDSSDGDIVSSSRDKEVTPYDFRRPTRLSRAQLRYLQRMYESALEGLTGALSQNLRTPVEANVLGVKALTYGSFTNLLPNPLYVNIFKIEPFNLRGVLTLDVPFCLAMVDRLLGGHGHTTEKPRGLTALEMAVLDWPVKLILEQLEKCWNKHSEVRFVSEGKRMDLTFAQIMHTTETVLRVSFALGGEIGSGEASFCVPFSALEKAIPLAQLREEMLGAAKEQSEEDIKRAQENLMDVSVPLSAELGNTILTVGEVLQLEPGQVVRLNYRADQPLPVKVGKWTKFLGKPGLKSRKAAIQITDILI